MHNINIIGMPYFPGVVMGKLHRGLKGDIRKCIVMVSQDEISTFDTLPAGVIVVEAAPFSHTMIQLISLGMPIVIISAQQAEQLHDGIYIQLDGASGDIQQGKASQSTSCKILDIPVAGEPLKSADGIDVYLRASVSNVAGSTNALTYGAIAIGLVRSEFFQPSSGNAPDTAFYTHVFTDICESATPLPVTIRLLDLALDKQPSWLQQIRDMQGPLGLQGVRLYNNKSIRQIVAAQITAIDKLATYFKLQLSLLFLTSLHSTSSDVGVTSFNSE